MTMLKIPLLNVTETKFKEWLVGLNELDATL